MIFEISKTLLEFLEKRVDDRGYYTTAADNDQARYQQRNDYGNHPVLPGSAQEVRKLAHGPRPGLGGALCLARKYCCAPPGLLAGARI